MCWIRKFQLKLNFHAKSYCIIRLKLHFLLGFATYTYDFENGSTFLFDSVTKNFETKVGILVFSTFHKDIFDSAEKVCSTWKLPRMRLSRGKFLQNTRYLSSEFYRYLSQLLGCWVISGQLKRKLLRRKKLADLSIIFWRY